MEITSKSHERGWGLFPDGWPGEVLQFVIDVWEDFRLPVSVKLEPRITKLLTGAIQDKYEAEGRDWFVIPEAPAWDTSGKETSRTDIRLYPPGPKRREICFVLENKCLNTPKSKAAEYVGKDGMMCFVSGKYSNQLPCGGMLGFVRDGNVPRAHKAVCKAIDRNRKQLCLLPGSEYQVSPLLKSHQFHGQTRLQFLGGKFTIYHLLLKVVRPTKKK
jgi:hypothetical protein